jgi:hypothetical protein
MDEAERFRWMYLLTRLRLVLAAYLYRGSVTGRSGLVTFRAGSGYVYPLTTQAGNNGGIPLQSSFEFPEFPLRSRGRPLAGPGNPGPQATA